MSCSRNLSRKELGPHTYQGAFPHVSQDRHWQTQVSMGVSQEMPYPEPRPSIVQGVFSLDAR